MMNKKLAFAVLIINSTHFAVRTLGVFLENTHNMQMNGNGRNPIIESYPLLQPGWLVHLRGLGRRSNAQGALHFDLTRSSHQYAKESAVRIFPSGLGGR